MVDSSIILRAHASKTARIRGGLMSFRRGEIDYQQHVTSTTALNHANSFPSLPLAIPPRSSPRCSIVATSTHAWSEARISNQSCSTRY